MVRRVPWLRLAWFVAPALVLIAAVGSATAIVQARGDATVRGRVAYTREWLDQQRGQGHWWVTAANTDGTDRHDISPRPGKDDLWEAVNPSWSLDGSRVAFVRFGARDKASGLYVANSDGSGLRRVLRIVPAGGGHGVDYASWSPDGQRLAYGNGPLYIVDRDGGHVRKLAAASTCNPVWSPDGKRLVYLAARRPDRGCTTGDGMAGIPGYRSLYAIDPDGSGRRLLASGSLGEAAWSPDGGQIAYMANCTIQHSGPADWNCSVQIMKPDGSGKHLLVRRAEGWVDWVARGKEVLWFTWGNDPKEGIYATNVSTRKTRAVRLGWAGMHGTAGVSQDGQTIAVDSGSQPPKMLLLAATGRLIGHVDVPPGWKYENASVYFP